MSASILLLIGFSPLCFCENSLTLAPMFSEQWQEKIFNWTMLLVCLHYHNTNAIHTFRGFSGFSEQKKQRESNSEKYYVLFVHGKDIKIHINCYFSALNMAINLLKKKNVFLFLPAIGDIGGSACFKQQPRVTNKHETSRSLMMLWIASSSYSRRWIRKEIWELKKGPHTI